MSYSATPWTAECQAPLSPTARVCLNSCPPSQWCSLTLLFSATLFSWHQDLFRWVGSSRQVAKILELQLQGQFFQWIFRIDFLYDWLVWSPCSPKGSQESSPTLFQSNNSSVLSLLYGPNLTSLHNYRENHSFDNTDLSWQSTVCFSICCLASVF